MPTYLFINRLFIIFWVLVCIILSYVDLSFITENISVDSDLIMQLRTGIGDDIGNSFRYTALFFSLIPESLVIFFVLIISSISLIIFMKDLRCTKSILISMYITLPAMLLFLPRPQKETIVIIMTIVVLWAFKSKYPQWFKLAILTGIYILYALYMRTYYFLILGTFFLLYFWDKMPVLLRIAAIFLIIGVLIILPEKFFIATQGMRDIINYGLGRTRLIRTGFLNPFPPENGFYFVLNYIYSIFRLNVPIFFTFGYKEIFHMISVFIIGRLVWMGLKVRNDKNITICAQLVLSHIIVLIIFEPDLGGYLRHVTSVFLYLTPMLLLYDTNNYTKVKFV